MFAYFKFRLLQIDPIDVDHFSRYFELPNEFLENPSPLNALPQIHQHTAMEIRPQLPFSWIPTIFLDSLSPCSFSITSDEDDIECCLCLQELESSEIIKMACEHTFCCSCISKTVSTF